MRLLSPDSTFMRGLSTATDAVWITLLIILTSVPVITLGTALTAAHYAARRSFVGIGNLTSDFLHAFKENFRQSLMLWLVFALPFPALVLMWLLIRSTALLPLQIVATGIWVMGVEWVWALQARFENSCFGTLRNSFIFGLTNWRYTIVLVLLDAGFIVLVYASLMWMPKGLFLLILLGPGGIIMIRVPIIEHSLRKYLQKS